MKNFSKLGLLTAGLIVTVSIVNGYGYADAGEIEKKYQKDVKEENKNQRAFYTELSAPKILYKCKNEDFEHAYGVNYGTYNRLLEKAIEDCGENNLKIIKKEK
jgi:hypothetical protein